MHFVRYKLKNRPILSQYNFLRKTQILPNVTHEKTNDHQKTNVKIFEHT